MIKTKSGATFSKTPKDWMFWDPKVKPKLQELVANSYSVVIFTNQGGVESGKTSVKELESKFADI